jgi:phosphohistidine phosphatase SixA
VTRRRFVAALAGAALAALAELACAQPVAAPELEGRALVAALRQGGYVLYLRHASTDFSQNDLTTDWADCLKQRNLTEGGRGEARAIGEALRALRIPVGPILASPYCRTMETARLAFGTPTPSNAVLGGPPQADDTRYAELRTLLSTPVAKGSNLAISGHGNPFRALAGPPAIAEGETAVVKPLGNGRFAVVARIAKTTWVDLLAKR